MKCRKCGETVPTVSPCPVCDTAAPGAALPAKRYAVRDTIGLDRAGGYVMRHRLAMTSEALHAKSDIADELGWRDQQIDGLRDQVARLERERDEANDLYRQVCEQYDAMANEFNALKAAPLDVEHAMELAEGMASAGYNEACNNDFGSGLPGARSALRDCLTKGTK